MFVFNFYILATALRLVSAANGRSVLAHTLDAQPGIEYHAATGMRFPSYGVKDQGVGTHQQLHALRRTRTNARSVAALLGAHQRQVGGYGYQNITTTTAYGTQYATPLVWNGTPLMMIVDTGSSDTWAVPKSFHCIDYAGNEIPQPACGFGPPSENSFQYGPVTPPQHMYIKYGDGEIVSGPMGYSDITIGNLTIRKQQVCLANTTYWVGNNVTTGLMGLAFPSLTSSYIGTDGDDHNPYDEIQYPPLFTNMVNQGLVQPFFSIAISRNSSGGVIAFGGTPYVAGLDYSTVAYLPLVITKLTSNPVTAYDYSFYTIIPDGWKWGLTTDLRQFPFIVDSGTTLCYLPPDLADAINLAFKPAAVYLWMYDAYFTACNAVAPLVAVVLDKTLFYLNPVDLIYRDMVDPLTGLCMTGIANGGSGPYILGDVFLQNVLATYDIGKAQMRFTGRQYY